MTREIEALSKVDEALSGLEKDEILRIWKWVADKYLDSSDFALVGGHSPSMNEAEKVCADDSVKSRFPTMADLLAGADHKSETDRFLLAAYWCTNGDVGETFYSSELTSVLKDSGYIISKVSNPIRALKGKKPAAYIVQTGKNSKTKGKNGRITLKLTSAGVKAAESLVGHEIVAD